jgi:hypothetical protein
MKKYLKHNLNKALEHHKEIVWVYFKSGNTKTNYDPYRNEGYVETFQNPLPLKLMVHEISANGLVAKEIGLSSLGAKEFVGNDNEIDMIKNASKIKYDEQYYTPFNKAVGSKCLISSRPLGQKAIICFVEGNS